MIVMYVLNLYRNLRQCPTGPTEHLPSYNFEVTAPSDLGLCYNQECETVTDQK